MNIKSTIHHCAALLAFGLLGAVGALAQKPALGDERPLVSFRLTHDQATQRITAWYIPSRTSTHRLVTGQFSLITPNGYTPAEPGSSQDAKLEITNINGSWQDFVMDNDLFMTKGFSPMASLEGLTVHQVGMAPQAVEIGEVKAGVPVPLFSFPATGKAGNVRIVARGEPIQRDILKTYGSNINNELSVQTPVKAFVKAVQLYATNDTQQQVSFVEAKITQPDSINRVASAVQQVGIEDVMAEQDILAATPNPATTEITLQYRLLNAGNAGIDLIDGQGRPVQTLVERKYHRIGTYRTQVTLQSVAAGMYFCLLKGEQTQKTIKLMIVK